MDTSNEAKKKWLSKEISEAGRTLISCELCYGFEDIACVEYKKRFGNYTNTFQREKVDEGKYKHPYFACEQCETKLQSI